jgi:hypothetical protein
VLIPDGPGSGEAVFADVPASIRGKLLRKPSGPGMREPDITIPFLIAKFLLKIHYQ